MFMTKKKVKTEKQAKPKITKDMLIGDIASRYPKTVEVMFRHGLHCIGCAMTAYESLEQGCKAHGMSNKDIDKMVGEMNRAVEKKAKQ